MWLDASNRDFQKIDVVSIVSENSEQQDGKRRGSRATSRTSSRHLGCSPLRCLMSSSNHAAGHTKHIVIFRNIPFWSKHGKIKMTQGIKSGATRANLLNRIA